MRKRALAPIALTTALFAAPAAADPYRLRVDGLAYTQAPQSPVGLIVLQGEDKAHPWVDTEALVWTGTTFGSARSSAGPLSSEATTADVLTMMVRLHDPTNFGELRLGRQFLTVGAVRPIHIDGADARARLPTGTSVEVFGGVPVVPRFSYAAYDWASGGRVAQRIGPSTITGVSYLQQRSAGRMAFGEVGLDFASSPATWFDVAARGAYDTINPGISEASASLAGRFGDLRPEVYGIHRSPSRLLPATSLFSALGDTPSDVIGAAVPWRMFPRLQLLPMAGARMVGSDVGLDATLRATLSLDDLHAGAILVEARRQDSGLEHWTGVRAGVRVPLSRPLLLSTELELVAPDDPRGRGKLWPWGLVALRWLPADKWQVAGAVESSSTPRSAFDLHAMVRVTRTWGAP